MARLFRFAELDDQVEACRRVFASATQWTVVRASDLEEGESQGLPVWSRHVGDPVLASNLTRRVDFALFMVAALEDDVLIHEAPAIVGRESAAGSPAGAGWPAQGARHLAVPESHVPEARVAEPLLDQGAPRAGVPEATP